MSRTYGYRVRRNHSHQIAGTIRVANRVDERASGHRLALEALEPGEGTEEEQRDERRLDGQIEGEEPAFAHGSRR